MAVVLLQQKDEQAAGVDLLGARDRGMHDRLLKTRSKPADGSGSTPRRRDRLERFGQDLVDLRAERSMSRHRSPAAPRLRLVRNREQKMLETDGIMAAIGGQPEAR